MAGRFHSRGPIVSGGYFDVGLKVNAQDLGFNRALSGAKDPGPDQHVNPQTQGFEIWVFPDPLRFIPASRESTARTSAGG